MKARAAAVALAVALAALCSPMGSHAAQDPFEGGAQRLPADAPTYAHLLRERDVVLWIGDETIEDGALPRFVNAALLRLFEDSPLRCGSIGVRGSTTASAREWAPRVVMTVGANVVFVMLGTHDAGFAREPDEAAAEAYGASLRVLIETLRARRVREVVVVSPIALDEWTEVNDRLYEGRNARLAQFAARAEAVAAEEGAVFLDLHTFTKDVWRAAHQRGGPAMTSDGVRPTEAGAIVAASKALRGLGVTGTTLGWIGWAPTALERFEPVREFLVEDVDPDPEQAARMFRLVRAMDVHDAHADTLWRTLDQRLHPEHQHRVEMLVLHRGEVERNWASVIGVLRGE
ncbi:MAG: hypothetical protein EA379_05645 [Phycisphaerales bacterium]|nr:MAG: hypothetical protein EA379_05645 [Phycisphaerales bacterium]